MRDILEVLHTRRSVKSVDMQEPGPDAGQLDDMLRAAARVSDHGRRFPYYFVVFEGAARAKIGAVIAERYRALHPDASDEKIEVERMRFMRAPCVVGVIYRKRRGKHPLWEQMMSVGAACQNLILAAHGHGFVAQWLSHWYAYDDEVRAAIGLDERDVVGGFIHIGSFDGMVEERERAAMELITTRWDEGVSLAKGDEYDCDKLDYPRFGGVV